MPDRKQRGEGKLKLDARRTDPLEMSAFPVEDADAVLGTDRALDEVRAPVAARLILGEPAHPSFATADETDKPLPFSWLVAAGTLSILAVREMLVSAGLSVQMASRAFDLACLAAAAAVVLLHATRRADRGWHRVAREITEHAGLFSIFCLTGAVAAYPIAAAGGGYVDAVLAGADAMLGFHWFAWYGFVAEHGWAQRAGRAAYMSIFVTPALLIAWFAITHRTAEARRFLACFWVAAVMTLAIARFLPVRGPLAGFASGSLPYLPVSGLFQAELPPELRLHEMHRIDLLALHGLVGAPSFHTASAVIYIVVGWRCRPLRWPILALNSAMLLATPVEGTHYLTDMLMGACVALSAIALTDRLLRLRTEVLAARTAVAP